MFYGLMILIFLIIIQSKGQVYISNCSDLMNITNSNISGCYYLINDIDMLKCSLNNGSTFSPIGNSSQPFCGYFDGLNHTISNLFYSSSTQQYIALFGYAKNATFSNTILYNAQIGGTNYTASLVGYATNTLIVNCHLTGNSTSPNKITAQGNYGAGIVGFMSNSNITNCTVANSCITCTMQECGGIAGHCANGFVEGCYNFGVYNNPSASIVSSQQNAGGVIGRACNSCFSKCGTFQGNISSTKVAAGNQNKNQSFLFRLTDKLQLKV